MSQFLSLATSYASNCNGIIAKMGFRVSMLEGTLIIVS